MNSREQALILRLVAAEVAHEAQSAFVLRRILRDLGWTEQAIDAASARVSAALWRQAEMFERAA